MITVVKHFLKKISDFFHLAKCLICRAVRAYTLNPTTTATATCLTRELCTSNFLVKTSCHIPYLSFCTYYNAYGSKMQYRNIAQILGSRALFFCLIFLLTKVAAV
jgi:hypothetical protein